MKKPKAEKNKISLWAKIKNLFDNSPWHCAFTYPILYILIIIISSALFLSANIAINNNNEEPGLLFYIGFFYAATIYLTPVWVLVGLIISKRRLPYVLSLILGLGIPAYISTVFYNGYTGNAKAAATKSNIATAVKYISAEVQKCSSGEITAMSGKLTCSEMTTLTVVTSAVSTLSDIRNPYLAANNAFTNGGNNTADSDVGYIRLIPSAKEIIVKSCSNTPCKKEQNRQQFIIKINQ